MTYHQLFQTPVKVVRPFNVYGPGMKPNDYRVVPTFFVKGIMGQPLPAHDKGNQTRTLCYISDAMTGFFKVLLSKKNGEVYNVGTAAEEVNMTTLANIIAGMFPKRAEVKLVQYPDEYPADEPQRRCPDLTKIKRELGYEPQVNLETGLTRALEWFRDTLPPEYLVNLQA
jgi:UDP-glucuronate decarboxylase